MTVGALDVRFLNPSIDQAQHPSAEHEQVANSQLLDKTFLHRSEPAMTQEDIDKTFRNDRPDVDQQIPLHPRMGERDDAIVDADFSENVRVLLRQRRATAFR